MRWSFVGLIGLTMLLSAVMALEPFVWQQVVRVVLPPQASVPPAWPTDARLYFVDDERLDWAIERWYVRLSDQARAAQLIMPAWDEGLSEADLKLLLENQIVGGFMLLRSDVAPETVKDMAALEPAGVPLLVASDAEPSLLKYRFASPPFTGETDRLTENDAIKTVGMATALLLQDYGINLNFAPVYDVGVNEAVIASRAFSDDVATAATRANYLAQTMLEQAILPTAKHFPGHGLAAGDSHEVLVTSADLSEVEGFKAAIAAHIPLIMVGHIAVTTDYYDTLGHPASLSSLMMQTLLRERLGFEGVIITDALNMGAVTEYENAGLTVLQAGADIALMPPDVVSLNQQIVEILAQDTVEARVFETKIKRVLRLKLAWKITK